MQLILRCCVLYLHVLCAAEAIALLLMASAMAFQLLTADEVWPGTSSGEFAARRERLANAMPAGTVAVIPAAQTQFMTGHIPYAFRQVCSAKLLFDVWPMF